MMKVLQVKEPLIQLQYNDIYELRSDKNILHSIIDGFKGIFNSHYRAWRDLQIDLDKYDAICIDFSKHKYVLNKLKNKKIILKAHNCEYDYSRKNLSSHPNLKKIIAFLFSKKQEYIIAIVQLIKIVKTSRCDTGSY